MDTNILTVITSFFDKIWSMFIHVKVIPSEASYRYLDTGYSKYTEVNVSFHIENNNSYPLKITDAKAFVKLATGEIVDGKLSPTQLMPKNLPPRELVHNGIFFIFKDIRFSTETEIHVILHLNAKKIKSLDLELIPIEMLKQKRKGTIKSEDLDKFKKKLL